MSSNLYRPYADNDPVHLVDLLEIYHARQLRHQVEFQVQRLEQLQAEERTSGDAANLLEIAAYYDALQLSLDHLLQALGDTN